MSPEGRETKAKINYLDYIKIKSFCTANNQQNYKKHPTEWKKVFANDISHKGLVSKIYKELIPRHKRKQRGKNIYSENV